MEQLLEKIKDNLNQLKYPNETAVSMGIVIPILKELQWPIEDMTVVYPEFPLKSRNVDFGLCPKGDKKLYIIIEVKRVGNLDAADQQLFEYAFHAGAGVAILTDGKEWHFYFPATTGSYGDKRFYKLDLTEQVPEEIIEKFRRYLSFENVKSDKFLEFAQEDLKKARLIIEAKETIPQAFKDLVQSADEQLLQLIAERVADQCGFSPDKKLISDYLQTLIVSGKSFSNIEMEMSVVPLMPSKGAYYFRIGKHEAQGKNPTELYLNAMAIISQYFEPIISKFHSGLKSYKRRIISRNKLELFPQRPDLVEKYTTKLKTGYWVDTNNSTDTKRKVLNHFIQLTGVSDSELIL